MPHEQCEGCRVAGKDCSKEPCCRCDSEAERKARLLDDPVLVALHGNIMELADNWARLNNCDWYRGQVAGAMAAWHTVALKMPSANMELVRQAIWEYSSILWGDLKD